MLNCIFRPLDKWPREITRDRRGSGHFSAGYSDTLDKLEKELGLLRASDVVIQIETTLDQIRNDGWPRSDARVTGPRVAVSFTSKHGPLAYYCDDCLMWQHNLRCIAMTLERLRMAEMYGVTKRGEQYQGFKSLPAGIQVGDGMNMDEAARFIATLVRCDERDIVRSPGTFRLAYRDAVKIAHPDAGGDSTKWHELQRAADLLKKHHHIA